MPATLSDRGNKPANRFQCVRAATCHLVTGDPREMTPEHRDAVIDAANQLYERSGFAGHERDGGRDRAFREALNYMLRTWEPNFGRRPEDDAVGTDTSRPWYGQRSLARAAEIDIVGRVHSFQCLSLSVDHGLCLRRVRAQP